MWGTPPGVKVSHGFCRDGRAERLAGSAGVPAPRGIHGSAGACRFPGERCDTVRSRREITGSPAHDPSQRSPAQTPTASLETAAGRSSGGAAGNGTAPHDGGSAVSPRPVPLAGRRSLYAGLKDWRVRSRLLLLVVLPTLAAVILGGVAVASSVRSAAAYQRVEQFSRLGGEITGLAQALQAER